ncbi:transmembrane protein 241 isoform X4 [Girardinichthys multiradiatus]|uniref:transmembrane protein 241 isoform X4 n=1 Tax=Girardinichthys multiradiatus TaxID=208333 RepID=UPI001FADE4C1|nr:transmembrane protein 241 isoform X4 [Girardinichthys multiradiatus]
MADIYWSRPASAVWKAGMGGDESLPRICCSLLASGLSPVCGKYIRWFQGLITHRHSLFLHSAELLSCSQLHDRLRLSQREETVAQSHQHLSPAAVSRQPSPFDHSGYLWALCHLSCVGAYRVFQVHHKSTNLSYIEQQCINYLFSVPLLGLASHPTGDITGALEFPSLQSHTFHCGCCASALLGFLLLLATARLKRGLTLEYFRVWVFLSKVTAVVLSPLVFYMDFNSESLLCVIVSHVGEALLLYSDRESPP